MSNLAGTNSLRLGFEWVMPPPTASVAASNLNISLVFTLQGPWIPEPEGRFQDEGLLFTVIANPIRDSRTRLDPMMELLKLSGSSQLPGPYNNLHENAFTFVPSTDVHAGRNWLWFSNFAFVSVPGTYRLDIWAFVVTPRSVRLLPGCISSGPIRCIRPEEMDVEAIVNGMQAQQL